MATIMRFHGEEANAFSDIAMQIAGSTDQGTLDFLPKPVANVEWDYDKDGIAVTATVYLEAEENGAVWYILLTAEDVDMILKALSNKEA